MSRATQECENGVIGAILSNNVLINEIDLKPSEFYNASNGLLYEEISKLISEGRVVDGTSLTAHMGATTAMDWTVQVFNIENDALGRNNITEYATHIRRFYHQRKLKEIADELLRSADEYGIEAGDRAINELMNLNSHKDQTEYSETDCVSAAIREAEDRNEGISNTTINTGISSIDNLLGGFQNSDLIIVGARPGMGKTALMLNFAIHSGVPAGVFSTEQGHAQVGARYISIAGGSSASRMRSNSMTDTDWAQATVGVSEMKKRNIRLDESTQPTIIDIQRKSRKWKHQHGIRVIFIDYIQRIKPLDEKLPTHKQLEQVVVGLKNLARELDMPVICLAQVNRNVDSRGDRRPSMGDLKDSGSIEQEADQIMMLYRDEVYNPESEDKGIAEISIEKNRHGPTGVIRAAWIAQSMQFKDLAPQYDYPG
jgi:replicative DNA helicase